jgi:hypothetical protein
MKKILNLCAMSLGGWIGWAVGARIGIFTAFIISLIGTGAGLYAAMRINHHFLD